MIFMSVQLTTPLAFTSPGTYCVCSASVLVAVRPLPSLTRTLKVEFVSGAVGRPVSLPVEDSFRPCSDPETCDQRKGPTPDAPSESERETPTYSAGSAFM